jgi:hypothetical protein
MVAVNRNSAKRTSVTVRVSLLWCSISLVAVSSVWGCSYNRKEHPSYCSSSADCADGYKCSKEHYCVLKSSCTTNNDCDTGYTCNSSQGCVKKSECQEGKKESCYDGTQGTQGVGVCRSGQRVCAGGVFTECLGQVVDSVEACNGLDDDCDGQTDNTDQVECDSGLLGACAKGELSCNGAFAVCSPIAEKIPEECNSVDDDCDGTTDEGTSSSCYPEGEKGCEKYAGDYLCKGVCTPGTRDCSSGSFAGCVGAITPKGEECTVGAATFAQDEDCDGQVDEACSCDPTTDTSHDCYAGPLGTQGMGACQKGTQGCDKETKVWGPCAGQVLPAPETCLNMGEDNDCDGVTDNLAGLGDFCVDEARHGICREGTLQCKSGLQKLSCTTIEPGTQIEACDASAGVPGTDEDCDGATDEDFNLNTDDHNCGACGRVCVEGQTCCQGGCVSVVNDAKFCGSCDNACGAGLSCCAGQCADLAHDDLNCGGCGTVCTSGKKCCAGACTNTQVDLANCGDCGIACAQGQFCCSGQCASETCSCLKCEQSGGTCCGDVCVDAKSDSLNCGGCGYTCDANQECLNGICCASGELNCDGKCVDPTRDESHCGGCGAACEQDFTCCDGCVDARVSSQHCGTCNNPCRWPTACSNGLCCGQGTVHCSGECVDIKSDERYCGSCDIKCDEGKTCCSGVCVDTRNDNANCGFCGAACDPSKTGNALCCQGVCVPYATSGYVIAARGCFCETQCAEGTVCCYDKCVNLRSDKSNCGACSNACTCGNCYFGTCFSSGSCSNS